MSTKIYVSVNNLADRFDVSVNTIWRWAKEKKLPSPVKFNGSTRWKFSEIIEWEKAQ